MIEHLPSMPEAIGSLSGIANTYPPPHTTILELICREAKTPGEALHWLLAGEYAERGIVQDKSVPHP